MVLGTHVHTHTHTHTHIWRRPCDDEGRDWSYGAISQRTPMISGKPPGATKRQGRIPLRFQREDGPANALILDLQPLEL